MDPIINFRQVSLDVPRGFNVPAWSSRMDVTTAECTAETVAEMHVNATTGLTFDPCWCATQQHSLSICWESWHCAGQMPSGRPYS